MALARASMAKSACRGSQRGSGRGRRQSRAERSLGYLLLGLGFLHHLAAHLNAGGEDGSGEVSYVDALQVADFLSSCGDTERVSLAAFRDSFSQRKSVLIAIGRRFNQTV